MKPQKGLHSTDDVDRLSSRKKRDRQHQDNVDASIQRLEDYIKRGGTLISASRNKTENTNITEQK